MVRLATSTIRETVRFMNSRAERITGLVAADVLGRFRKQEVLRGDDGGERQEAQGDEGEERVESLAEVEVDLPLVHQLEHPQDVLDQGGVLQAGGVHHALDPLAGHGAHPLRAGDLQQGHALAHLFVTGSAGRLGQVAGIEQAQVGALQIARISVGAMGPVVDDLNVFNMPFVFRDEAHMRKVIDGPIGDELLKKISDSSANLVALGLRPEDIHVVMCTHLHFDHVGWNTKLENGKWVPTFPNARYVFGRREFAAAEAAAIAMLPTIRERVLGTEDAKEGIRSFVERRAARFQGR